MRVRPVVHELSVSAFREPLHMDPVGNRLAEPLRCLAQRRVREIGRYNGWLADHHGPLVHRRRTA